ncbi:MAG: hypothetical protein NT128_06110 [Proteobacteria bacterium]|nr:hypothetical protein [Pseudomonadota bacterium]
MASQKTAKFEKKLSRINHHLILNTLFSVSFLRRRINSGEPKIPTTPWLNDP